MHSFISETGGRISIQKSSALSCSAYASYYQRPPIFSIFFEAKAKISLRYFLSNCHIEFGNNGNILRSSIYFPAEFYFSTTNIYDRFPYSFSKSTFQPYFSIYKLKFTHLFSVILGVLFITFTSYNALIMLRLR